MTKTTTQFLGFPSLQLHQQQGAAAVVDTPTIVDKLAQWLQAEKCQEMHESYERTGNVEALATIPVATSTTTTTVDTSYNISNKNALMQGGTITINPTTFVRLADYDQQDTDRIPVVVNEVIEEQKLPLPVVQTNRKRTMVTRSLSRQVSEVANNNIKEEEEDPDYAPDSPDSGARAPPPAKKSRRSVAGRKPKSTRGDGLDDLPPEEREKVRSRRQKNKEAAARCRQKRVDLTDRLSKEVEEHQAIKVRLEQEIKKLRMEQENLRRVLENHQAYGCRLQMPASAAAAGDNVQVESGGGNQIYLAVQPHPQPQQPQPRPQQQQQQQQEAKPFAVAIKSAPVIVEAANAPYVLPDVTAAAAVPEHQPLTKPTRPQTLTLGGGGGPSLCSKPDKAFIRDEELETPSKIVANLFEQSGFTPTSIFGNIPSLNTPTCSFQQRSSELAVMTSSADLNTPCNDTGAISLTAL